MILASPGKSHAAPTEFLRYGSYQELLYALSSGPLLLLLTNLREANIMEVPVLLRQYRVSRA